MHIARIHFDRSPVSTRFLPRRAAVAPAAMLAVLVALLFVGIAYGMSSTEGQDAYMQVEMME